MELDNNKKQLRIELSKTEILKRIKNNPLEDFKLLGSVEKILSKRRGHVFKMPKKGTKVLVFLSGGIDTAITTLLLLEKYQLKIVPVFISIERDNRSKLLKAAKDVVKYYKYRYPDQVDDLIVLSSTFPPQELLESVVDNCWNILDKKTGKVQGLPFELDTFTYSVVAMIYNSPKYSKVRTIFYGIHAGDGTIHQHHSLTSFRSLMFHVCALLGDFSFQISSLPIEKEVGLFLDKKDLINIGLKYEFPFEITRTCRNTTFFPCGECVLCEVRKNEFFELGIKDPARYKKSFFATMKTFYENSI